MYYTIENDWTYAKKDGNIHTTKRTETIKMIQLFKFYDLINRNATVTLTNPKLDTTYFEGAMKNIPDKFDNCNVTDFCVSNDGDFLFRIEL